MSKVSITGNASGTGTFTIAAPNSNTDRTLTLPDEAGTILTSASDVLTSASNLDFSKLTGQRYFYAYSSNAVNQSISAQTWTIVNLPNVIQSNSSFNTGTYTWTATAADAGFWMFLGQVSFFTSSNNGGEITTAIQYNSTRYGVYTFHGSSSIVRHFGGNANFCANISSGDTISLRGYINATSPLFFGGDGSASNQNVLIGVKLA